MIKPDSIWIMAKYERWSEFMLGIVEDLENARMLPPLELKLSV